MDTIKDDKVTMDKLVTYTKKESRNLTRMVCCAKALPKISTLLFCTG